MKKTLIFDLDGTLLNTLGDLHKSTNYALKSFEYPERTLNEVLEFVGNGIRKLLERACPEGTEPQIVDEATRRMKVYYAGHIHDLTVPYPGILSLLKRLKEERYSMAIVSNKADPLIRTLNSVFFEGIIPVAIGERAELPRKPRPDMVLAALSALDRPVEDAIFIGDSEVDLLTAKNCGIPSILVGWGFRDTELLHAAGAERIAMDTDELYQMIQEV